MLILAPIFLSDGLTVDQCLDRRAGMADRWILSCFFKHVEDSLETFAEEPWIRTLFQLGLLHLFASLLSTALVIDNLILEKVGVLLL